MRMFWIYHQHIMIMAMGFLFSFDRIEYTLSVPFIGGGESATAQLRLKEKLKPEVKDEFVCWR